MTTPPVTVNFVCTGNICRSPMAANIFRAEAERAGLDLVVVSSGTGSWHVGDPAHHRTQATLAKYGYPTEHVATTVGREHADNDLFVALDRGHATQLERLGWGDRVRLLRSFDPGAGSDLDVPDPYYGEIADYEIVYAQIQAALPGLLEWAHTRTSTS